MMYMYRIYMFYCNAHYSNVGYKYIKCYNVLFNASFSLPKGEQL